MITLENRPIYYGESTDDKPTDADVNSKFEELDTGDADKAATTSAFNTLKLQGNAMVEKGGDNQ